jgi:Leucine-rich repeat (LRR) protein
MNLPKTLNILAKLPNLKSLHLENDHLKSLPSELLRFKNLEKLYLGNNELKQIPVLKTLDHLKYLDLKNNNIETDIRDMKNLNFGLKINF